LALDPIELLKKVLGLGLGQSRNRRSGARQSSTAIDFCVRIVVDVRRRDGAGLGKCRVDETGDGCDHDHDSQRGPHRVPTTIRADSSATPELKSVQNGANPHYRTNLRRIRPAMDNRQVPTSINDWGSGTWTVA